MKRNFAFLSSKTSWNEYLLLQVLFKSLFENDLLGTFKNIIPNYSLKKQWKLDSTLWINSNRLVAFIFQQVFFSYPCHLHTMQTFIQTSNKICSQHCSRSRNKVCSYKTPCMLHFTCRYILEASLVATKWLSTPICYSLSQ